MMSREAELCRLKRVTKTYAVDWVEYSAPRGPFWISVPGDHIKVVGASFDERNNQLLITVTFDFKGWDAVHSLSNPYSTRVVFACTPVVSNCIGKLLLIHDNKAVYQLELPRAYTSPSH
ncbi:hypothetical protein [uncultured Desulfovibrio sp.]|uniref:hypothetical protein n=1 Tax=uncultured Desulfovibrio sp. TaxID=167968 RepID=UPI002634EBE6|nr:hypothetical protein [uncultured Desulfovibrio sp.]